MQLADCLIFDVQEIRGVRSSPQLLMQLIGGCDLHAGFGRHVAWRMYTMAREFKLPDLGEGIVEGQIVRVLIKQGDTISEDQAIMEVETDKAAVEIPSPYAGVANKIHVKEGETVAVGQVLVSFDASDSADESSQEAETVTKSAAAPARKESSASAAPTSQNRGGQNGGGRSSGAATMSPPQPTPAGAVRRSRAIAAPAIRKFARESGIDIDTLTGSGSGGRVTREDVQAALSGGVAPAASAAVSPSSPVSVAAAPAPSIAAAPQIEGIPGKDSWGPIKRQRLSQIRKTIANQMVRSVSNIPHVTQTDDADVTELDQIRRALRGEDGSGPRVTMTALIIRALAVCLREHPWFNTMFDEENEEMVYKEYINIGVAVDSPRGLVVPVIRDADRLSVLGISQALSQIGEKVRNVQFAVDDLRGGTFTVTNYGAIGSIYGTPIINFPEVAILGLGRTQPRLTINDEGELEERFELPMSLSFDHRAVDGAQAARFLNDIKAHLSNPGLLMIK